MRRLRALLATLVLALPACGSLGPGTVDRDRFDYVNAIASSWKQQTLLNIVKLRYADTPVFLDVGQIISGYQLEGTVAVQGTLNSRSALGDLVTLGSAGRYTDRPTITYTPLTGAHFLHVMMTPIPPPALFRLIESGWPADLLLQVAAQEINGISNRRAGVRARPADPEFATLLEALGRVQESGAIGLRVERSDPKSPEGAIMTIRREKVPPEVQADSQRIRQLLGLPSDRDDFRVVYGALARTEGELAVQTRSAFQIMTQLGADVEVPAKDVAEQRTYPSEPPEPQAPGSQALAPLMRIRSSDERPDDGFVAVRYRDHWFWIDDRDLRSKRIFTFLMILTTLAEKGDEAPKPVVTIQGN